MSSAQRKMAIVSGLIAACGVLCSNKPASALTYAEGTYLHIGKPSDPSQAQLLDKQLKRPSLLELLDTIPARQTGSVEPTPIPASTVPSGDNGDVEFGADVESNEEAVRLLLNLSERRVYVYRGDSVATSYPVAVGRAGWETPTGEFEVFHQLVDPGWTNPITSEVMPPGPNNPLGDRWIAFWTDGTNSIGFHGTPNRESVGRAASHGCIRMYNEDIRELYSMVEVGTPVTVIQ